MIARQALSQFLSLEIRRSAFFMFVRNDARRIWKLQSSERAGRELAATDPCSLVESKISGTFSVNPGNGETVELYGLCRVEVTEQLKINKIEVFYDPDTFIEVLKGEKDVESVRNGKAILGEVGKTAVEKILDQSNEGQCQ